MRTAGETFLRKARSDETGTSVGVAESRDFSHEKFKRDLNMAYVAVDEPQLRGLVGDSAELTADIGYVRFHGRNAGNWWQHEQAYERYDYLYQEPEMQEWVPRIHSLAQGADRIFVTFNNHYKGQSITNARMMRQLL